jgi:hypothetical protein
MANPSEKSSVNVEKYEGPGKLTTAIDRAFSWGSIAYGIGMVFALKGKITNSKVLNWGSGIVAVFGYSSAAKGEHQFESMRDRLSQSQMHVMELQTTVNSISREVGNQHKSFSEHLNSRTAHDSHSSAVVADKASTAMAEAAR